MLTSEQKQDLYQQLRNYSPLTVKPGKALYAIGAVLGVAEKTEKIISVIIKSQSANGIYKFTYYLSQNNTNLCSCPVGHYCKHGYAAIMWLINHSNNFNLIPGLLIEKGGQIKAEPIEATYLLDKVKKSSGYYPDYATYYKSVDNLEYFKINLLGAEKGKLLFAFDGFNKNFEVSLTATFNSPEVKTICNCGASLMKNCAHGLTAITWLIRNKKDYNLHAHFDYSKIKNTYYAQYGIEPDSKLVDKFKFNIENGVLQVDAQNVALINTTDINYFTNIFNLQQKVTEIKKSEHKYRFIYVMHNGYNNNEFRIDPLIGKVAKNGTKFIGKLEPFKLDSNINELQDYEPSDFETITELKNINSCKSVEQVTFLNTFFKKIIGRTVGFTSIYSVHNLPATQVETSEISEKTIKTSLTINIKPSMVELIPQYSINPEDEEQPLLRNDFLDDNPILLNDDNYLYSWHSPEHYLTASLFKYKSKPLYMTPLMWDTFFENMVKKAQNKVNITIQGAHVEVLETEPTFNITLSDMDKYIMFTPIVEYNNNQFASMGQTEHSHVKNNHTITKVIRNKVAETAFREYVASLHPTFNSNSFQEFFYLNPDQLTHKFWFLDFYQKCREQNVTIYGFDKLKKIKYNPNRPTAKVQMKSGIDWFDVTLNVEFGNQQVSLAEIRKALHKKQNLIQLSDGSLGILPEDWLKQWTDALELGKIDGNKIRLSKFHYTLLNSFANEANDTEILAELEEKRQLLANFNEVKEIKVSKDLKATLRPYQQSGLNWLNCLASLKWGGILADDMGLGKTIQLIAFMLHIKKESKKNTPVNLVVCPTTLLFNWKSEIEKFAPKLNTYTHWGPDRVQSSDNWNSYDVIFTSYGTIINDIELFGKYEFTTIIIDESQAIKNTSSQRYQAVCLLKAQYRFALTGTPIENNVLELFAQMQFINPGILGTFNYFKNEYSVLDKNTMPERTEKLKKIIYPFILRRTKEQVATDLPERTEMVLYCEMESEQRKVYDYFKTEFKAKFLKLIDEEGIEKAKFNVLDSLLKLRQICDSPQLLNYKEDFGTASTKADELMRHIREKTGSHKVLVFTQFLGMMDILKQRLDHDAIKYVTLTGATKDRKGMVDEFQQNTDIRVFLISLKAGGVGLNLTEADYVYIVEPWWNPAVENQAIDRAHRIGQQNHVFAYRMICKGTVEEKIIEMQNKKKNLAAEVLGNEQGFVKNLTKEDIEALFD